ncbi:MAG: hypothetical protein GWN25_37945 [Actinobacteria bacterium]|nr:hypothetical protein [Actinomycetota bacterium]
MGATVDGPPAFGSAQVDVEAPLPVLNVDIDAPPAPTATVDVDARHGGSVVHAGPHPIEVVPHASGEVHAYVQGPRPPEARLTVDVPVRGRPRGRPVRLEWDADAGHYRGAVPRGVHIVPGPVAVHYHVGPRVYDVHAPHVVVGPTIVIDGPRWHWGRGKFRGHGKFRGRGHGKFRGMVPVGTACSTVPAATVGSAVAVAIGRDGTAVPAVATDPRARAPGRAVPRACEPRTPTGSG